MSFGRFKDDTNTGKNQNSSDASNSANFSSAGSCRNEVYIGKGSKIVGNLHFSGPAELDGQIDGDVIAEDRIVVGESAIINAKLKGGEVTIKGNVTGDIVATKRLLLKKPAKVVGSLSSPLLSIEEGVIFEGKIAMVSEDKKLQSATAAGSIKSTETVLGTNASTKQNPVTAN